VSYTGEYKYNPDTFKDILGLADDFNEFYELYEKHIASKNQTDKIFLENVGMRMFFTIKHRLIEGAITKSMAREMLDYIEELLDD